MNDTVKNAFQARISLLEYLGQRGWKPARDNGREEVAGLCPLHRDSHPSFYVNRRKQVFYCHGCGRGGGLTRLIDLLGDLPQPASDETASEAMDRELLLERTYRFYQTQLARFENAREYLAARGIWDRSVIAGMRIGYAPGACLRGRLERLGYNRRALLECGLVDERGRDSFFRCLTFPLQQAGNLYGRSMGQSLFRHRFLPGSKGGLYGWAQALAFPRVIVVEGLFDVAALWQAGFPNTVAVLGSHLNNLQIAQFGNMHERVAYICFDADSNGGGQRAARCLSIQLRHAGVEALRVELPRGHDPASYFAAGASSADFERCLERARP
jgi:DNA primase